MSGWPYPTIPYHPGGIGRLADRLILAAVVTVLFVFLTGLAFAAYALFGLVFD